MPNCDDNVVQDLYMLLPTDKRTLVLAGIPELLLWIIFLCIPLVVCHSGIISSEMSSTYTVCVYCVSVLILCILSKNLFLGVFADKFSYSTLPLAAVATSTFSIVKDRRQLIH